MVAKSGVPMCLYADGMGLREIVQQLSMFDSVALTGTGDRQRIEWVYHLYEHFTTAGVVRAGRYRAGNPQCLTEIRPESRADLC